VERGQGGPKPLRFISEPAGEDWMPSSTVKRVTW